MIYINGRFLTQNLSGAQRAAYEITRILVTKTDLDIIVLVPPLKVNDAYEIDNFNIQVVGTGKNLLWEQLDLPFFLIKNKSPLLINLLNTAPIVYKNQIVTILDMTTFINPKWFNKLFAYYYQLIVPAIANRSLKIITISENSKNDILKFIKIRADKIVVLYCGISPSFNDTQISTTGILDKLNIRENRFILSVSSLDPRKNFVKLVKAYNEIKPVIYPLVIVGSEGRVFANDELKEIISNSGNIILTGYLSDQDLIALYRTAYCFVYPSLYEGFGMPPLEAMACGCPTIVSNTSSLPEVCGEASLYINPQSSESIKNAIINIVNNNDLRLNLITAGKDQVKKFTWENSGFKLRDIIKNILQ